MPAVSGPGLFSRYAFPPNDLGHCGPAGAETLLAGGSGVSDDDRELRSRAACFDGAWPYLELLARSAQLSDPLAPEVVSAYWHGGELLDNVRPEDFAATVGAAFGGQPGVLDRLKATPGLLDAGPSHAFHVFVVYPWVGLLGRGGDAARSILDQCMVRWGTVEWVDGDQAGVSSSALQWDDARLGLGPEQLEVRRWAQDGHAFVRDPRPGDRVSMHWDWISDRLSDDDVTELSSRTMRQLEPVNRWLTRHVVRCDPGTGSPA